MLAGCARGNSWLVLQKCEPRGPDKLLLWCRMVATTVLYGCHSIVGAVVCFKAHNARSMALLRSSPLHL